MENNCGEHELISIPTIYCSVEKKAGEELMQKWKFNNCNREATRTKTIRTSAMLHLNNQPKAKADVAHLRNMKYVKNC